VLLNPANEIDVPVVDFVPTPATVTLHTVPLARPLSVNVDVKVPLATENVTDAVDELLVTDPVPPPVIV
jgi:hypothetical protein